MAVKRIGPGLPLLQRAVLALSRSEVVVGVPADAPARSEPGAPSNADIAYCMEYGVPELNIPARPSIGPGIERAKPEIAAALKAAGIQALKDTASLKGTADGAGPVERGLETVGQIGVAAIQDEIRSGSFAPLSEATIRARRARGNTSAQPLFDTGQLHDAIGYRVRPKRR